MERGITVEHVRKVGAISDPILRNLWITLTYSDLSNAVRERAAAPNDANWLSFGSWASNTVGATMRLTEAHEAVRVRIAEDEELKAAHSNSVAAHIVIGRMKLADLLHPVQLARRIAALAGAAGAYLGHGNMIVFNEIGAATAKWVEIVDAGGPIEQQRADMAAFCADAPIVLGENRLAAGCDLLFDAREADDPAVKAQMLLASSLQFGAHEQTQLQDAIRSTFGVAVDDAIDPILEESLGIFHRFRVIRWSVRRSIRPIEHRLGELWHHMLTEVVLVFELAGEKLHLGRDIGPPAGASTLYPPSLQHVTFEPLVEALAAFDHSDGRGGHTRSIDWVEYPDRMSYIVNMFRSRQCVAACCGNPFTPEQIDALERDEIPAHL